MKSLKRRAQRVGTTQEEVLQFIKADAQAILNAADLGVKDLSTSGYVMADIVDSMASFSGMVQDNIAALSEFADIVRSGRAIKPLGRGSVMQSSNKTLERIVGFLKLQQLDPKPELDLEDLDDDFTFKSVEDFADFLSNILVPDLKDSGMDATAEDFEYLVQLLDTGQWDEDFVSFLEETLIPDLKESGTEATAEDFETGLKFLREMR